MWFSSTDPDSVKEPKDATGPIWPTLTDDDPTVIA